MKRLYIPIVITPTLTLPRQRGRGIPGFPDGHYLVIDSTDRQDNPEDRPLSHFAGEINRASY